MKNCKTCAASFIGPMACQVCNQGDFMTQREVLTEELKSVLTQEARQKSAIDLLAVAEMFVRGAINETVYAEKTRGILAAMNAEIREKTGGCNG